MKKFSLLAAAVVCFASASCEKPQSEAERNAQVEQEVQQRVAAERQADEAQRLAQQQNELSAREQALSDREAAANASASASMTPPRRPISMASVAERNRSKAAESTDEDAPQSYDTFYRKLEPYGAWRETSDYGYVWQPEQAQRSRDWRPYTDGRWAYTDAGWTWVSEEPFGWATYHYGRWTRLRSVGWVWVPGDEWAPAWVSWRKSDQYVGWAPLPPEAHLDRHEGIQHWADSYYDIGADEYVFIPNEAIGAQRIEQEVVPVDRNITIVTETTNVTNITYNNTIVVNQGPNYDELRAHSRQPLERLHLERRSDATGSAPQAVVRGDVLAVTAPAFAARATEPPRSKGEPIRQVAVERNWTGNANTPEAERAREKMKSEATPPPNAPPKRYEKPTTVAATPTPTASVGATTATPAPTSTATPIATATTSVRATASPVTSATVSPSPRASVPATATPRATFSPRATVSPSASPLVSASPHATAAASATPSATPSASASAAFSPRVRPTIAPVPTPAATTSPSASPVATPNGTHRPITTPLPTLTATPARAATPTATGASSPAPTATPGLSAGPVNPRFRSTPPPAAAFTPLPPRPIATPPHTPPPAPSVTRTLPPQNSPAATATPENASARSAVGARPGNPAIPPAAPAAGRRPGRPAAADPDASATPTPKGEPER